MAYAGKSDFSWKMTLKSNSNWKRTGDKKGPLVNDDLRWKATYGVMVKKWLYMKKDFWWKVT